MTKATWLLFFLLCSTASFSQEETTAKPSLLPQGSVYVKGSYNLFSRLARLSPSVQGTSMESVAKQFRSGTVFSAEAGIRVANHQYIGLTHSRYSQSGSFRMTYQIQSSTLGTLTMWDEAKVKETVSYTGLNYTYALPLSASQRAFFTTKAGMGLWGYNTEATAFSMSDQFKKTGLGYQLGAGFAVRISRAISWVADLDLLTGSIDIEEDEKENLSQIRAGTGLMLHF